MSGTEPTLELFVRSLTPSGAAQRQEAILDRLNRLDDRGAVDGYTVTVWGQQVVPDSLAARTVTGERITDAVAEFRRWAAETGVSVERFFTERTVDSAVTGDRYAATELPVFALAEYEDGELVSMTPHERETGVRTVPDHLDRLADRADRGEDATTAAVA